MKTPNIVYADDVVKWDVYAEVTGLWVCARPYNLGGFHLLRRLKLAWYVFTGKYAALLGMVINKEIDMKKTATVKCTICSFTGEITLVHRKTDGIIFKNGIKFNVTGDCPKCGVLLISYHTASKGA